MISKEELDNLIQAFIGNEYFGKIINSEEFYFQRLLDLYNEYKAFDTSSFDDKLQDFIENPPAKFNFQKLLDETSHALYYDFFLLIGKMIAVFDEKGYNTTEWNPYDDGRRISRAGLRQDKWTYAFLKYKLNGFNFDGLDAGTYNTFKNSIAFIEEPANHLNVTSNNHRKFISEYFLNKSDDFQDADIISLFEAYCPPLVNPVNKGVLVTNILYRPSIKKLWQIGVVGLIAADCTGWFDEYIDESEGFDAGVIWNSSKPVGGKDTLKYLKDAVESGDGFNIYYSCRGQIKYKAKIIDFALNQKELTAKNWESTYPDIYEFNANFDDYKDPRKHAQIVYLADRLQKIDPIPIEKFKTFNSRANPVQDNMVPLQSEPEEIVPINIIPKKTVNRANTDNDIPLNQILYGPPGTGKTYHTVNKALEVLGIKSEGRPRNLIKKDFDDCVKNGRIVFCTFHQSLAYEDFIEGLKPLKPSPEKNEIAYDVVPGLFKRVCESANRALQDIDVPAQDKTYSDFIEDLSTKIEAEGKVTLKSKTGTDVIIHSITDDELIYASPKLLDQPYRNYGVSKDKLLILDAHFISIKDIGNVVEDIRKVVSGVAHTYYWAVLKAFKDFKEKHKVADYVDTNKNKNYVLIIDEINRGNVSQIFGELITLIEKDKRTGNTEALEVTLPYSKDKFSVPPNLYLIGTMNTADRSVEALDTALRRRFSFVEMPSKPELLSPQQMIWQLWWDFEKADWTDEPWATKERELYDLLGAGHLSKMSIEEKRNLEQQLGAENADSSIFNGNFIGLNLKDLLTKINQRIEKLLSPDHAIGHSYFMSVCSWSDLTEVVYNKIIPLLQEYFYGDFGKIGLVLGKGFIGLKNDVSDDNLFAQFDYNIDDLKEREVYEILDYRKKDSFEVDLGKTAIVIDFKKAIYLLIHNKLEENG